MSDENDGLWICKRTFEDEFSIDETYATRQDAIDGYADEYGAADGETFQTGRLRFIRQMAPQPYDADAFFERTTDACCDEWWEGSIENLDDQMAADGLKEELDAKLEQLWTQFCEKHNLFLEGYHVEDVETHTVGEDESPEALAERKREEASGG